MKLISYSQNEGTCPRSLRGWVAAGLILKSFSFVFVFIFFVLSILPYPRLRLEIVSGSGYCVPFAKNAKGKGQWYRH